MPRSRNIKYKTFMDDKLAENDPLGRILYMGMWAVADCNGNFEWRKKKVKAEILPYDDCDVEALSINLDKSGFIRFYSDGELLYCNIPTFKEDQNPHKNEREIGDKVPPYSEEMRQLIDFKGLTINLDKSGLKRNLHPTDPADSCILNPESCILNPDYQNPEKSCQATPDDTPNKKSSDKFSHDVDSIFEHWVNVMGKPQAKLTKGRKSKIIARLKEGYPPDKIKQAIDGCSRSRFHMGENDGGRLHNDLTLICRTGEKLESFLNEQVTFDTPPAREETTYERVLREKAEFDAARAAKNIKPTEGEIL